MASFRPFAFELEAKEICLSSTSSHSQQELLPDLTVLPFFDSLFWFPALALYALQQAF